MFKKIFGHFSYDIGIDLGTANTLVYVREKGIVINEPSVVAINLRDDSVVAVGIEAKKMVGKTPGHIVAIRPLKEGIISDFEVTERMLKYFIDKVHHESLAVLPRPRVIVGIPLDVTEVEKKAVEDAALSAGAREVFLIEQPMAAAIGARLPVQEATGNLVVDIGGGTTDIAVISLGGVVNWKSLKTAGDEMNRDIITYARENFNILLGERTAERIKMEIGTAVDLNESAVALMRGRDLISGLPKELEVHDQQIREALQKTVRNIVESVKLTVEQTPPELVADLYEHGIFLTGGGALLRGLDKLITMEVQIPVRIAEDPLTAVVRGTGVILEDLDSLKNVLVPSTRDA